MPIRTYTLTDVIGQLNAQSSSGSIVSVTNPLASLNVVDEAVPCLEAAAAASLSNPTWDNGVWGCVPVGVEHLPTITEVVPFAGGMRLAVYEQDGSLVDERVVDNVMCVNGLTAIAAALSYAGIADIATNLGVTTPVTLTPMYGAVGGGSGTPAQTDTILFSETARTTVAASASNAATTSAGSQSVLLFFFGTSASTWTITEAGAFAIAGSGSGTGTLIDHALISPSVTKTAAQVATLQITFTIGV